MASGLEPIAGIRPVAPDVSLLDAATRLVDVVWRSGVAWRSSGCPEGFPWPGICPEDGAEKDSAPDISEVEVRPFGFYVPYACDWVTDATQAEMDADALAQMEAVSAWHVSRELWAGDANQLERDIANVNPTLMSTGTDIGGVAPSHPVYSVGVLLSEYAACAQSGGAVLHVPIVLIPYLTNQGVLKMENGRLTGPLGTPVSPGPGYPGPGPWGPDGEAAPPGAVWVYVTGPIEYALTEPTLDPDTAQRRWDRRRNRYELWAERRGIVRFNPCCVFAILVDIPESSPEAS